MIISRMRHECCKKSHARVSRSQYFPLEFLNQDSLSLDILIKIVKSQISSEGLGFSVSLGFCYSIPLLATCVVSSYRM